MKKILWISIFIFTIFSCKKSTVYNPVEYGKNDFMQHSKEEGKKLQEQEDKKIESWLKNNNHSSFTKTSFGFWIQITKNNDNPLAKELQLVTYELQFEDFLGNIIYTFEEKGIQKMVLGKTHEIRAIENAIRLMAKGEEATILSSSFMAYGLYGDENKIGKFVPLIIHIKLLDVKNI